MSTSRCSVLLVVCISLLGCANARVQDANEPARIERGNRAYAAGEWQLARAAYETALRSDQSNPELWFRLANIDQYERRLDAAEQKYRRVLALRPRHERAQYNLAVVYLSRAEQHFQYFSALSGAEAQSPRLTALLTAISHFAQEHIEPETPLAQLGALLGSDQEQGSVDVCGPKPKNSP